MERKMWSVFLSIILCCVFAGCEGNDCDPVTGHNDGYVCSNQLPSSGDYKWYLCANTEYLQILSGGSDRCINGASYCWFYCSLEDQNSTCGCSNHETLPSHPSLPSWCFNPSGKTCSWYRKCLNVKHPCGNSTYDYALSFGEHFCKAYDKSYHGFSSPAQDWIDAVRRCLQVKLVYVLRPWKSLSCQAIQTAAFASHTGCYLSPAPGAPSICSLGVLDWWRVFWTIKGAFVSATGQTMKGFLESEAGCIGQFVSDLTEEMRNLFAVVILRFATVTDELDTFAQGVADKIAKKLGWDNNTLDWYAYTEVSAKARRSSDSTKLILLIGDKVALGMAQAIDTSPTTNLEDIVRELSTAAESGYLDDIVKMESLEACSDLKCNDRYIQVDMDKPSDDSSAKRTSIDFLVWIFGLTALLLI